MCLFMNVTQTRGIGSKTSNLPPTGLFLFYNYLHKCGYVSDDIFWLKTWSQDFLDILQCLLKFQIFRRFINSTCFPNQTAKYVLTDQRNTRNQKSTWKNMQFWGHVFQNGRCPAWGATCSKCKKTIHFASRCKNSLREESERSGVG